LDKLPFIVGNYSPKNIFNADETGNVFARFPINNMLEGRNVLAC